MRLLEDFLQFFQLIAGEGGAVASLLALVALSLTFVERGGDLGAGSLLRNLGSWILHTEVATIHPCGVGVCRKLRVSQPCSVFTWRERDMGRERERRCIEREMEGEGERVRAAGCDLKDVHTLGAVKRFFF